MKRAIILALGCTLALSANAQAKAPSRLQSRKAQAQKSVYYMKPAGTLFQGMDTTGNFTGTTYLYVPGNSWTTFKKVVPEGASYEWHQNIYGYDDRAITFDRTNKSEDGVYYSDEDGNFVLHSTFNGANVLPTIVSGTDSFTLSEGNPYWAPYNENTPSTMAWYPQIYSGTVYETWNTIRPLSYTDERISNVGFGALSNNYLFGSGTYGNYTAVGLEQAFESPVAPLWIENVYLEGLSVSRTPIPSGTSLKLSLLSESNDTIAVFTASAKDVNNYATFANEGTTYYQSAVIFKRPEGGVVLDQPFNLKVDGLDATGVDLGFLGFDAPYYYEMTPTDSYFKDASGKLYKANLYSANNLVLQVNFSGKFDYCNAYISDGDNYGDVQQSDDGQTTSPVYTERYAFDGAAILLNGDWTKDGVDQYSLSGLPDWVTDYEVDDKTYKQYGLTIIKFTTTQLPANIKGRQAKININGKGVTSTDPIILTQGDRNNITNGISSVKAVDGEVVKNQPVYNLAGQRVGDSYKGVVIVNGKKVIR